MNLSAKSGACLAFLELPRSCAGVAHVPGYRGLLPCSLSRRFSRLPSPWVRENRRERGMVFLSFLVAEKASATPAQDRGSQQPMG